MKLHFIRYHEARHDLLIQSSPALIFTKSFNAGLRLTRNCGYRLKRDALHSVEQTNRAAGKAIAEYAGAFEPQSQL
jgi:hypothetical protein